MDIEEIKEIAAKQSFLRESGNGVDEDFVGFEFNGKYIINPWLDPSEKNEITTKEAIALYGQLNMIEFCEDIVVCYEY